MIQFTINISLNLSIDAENNSVTIENQTIQLQPPQNVPLEMSRKLGVAEKRYGILTLGSKSPIGKVLPQDTDITVVFDGISYPAHTHKTNPGRIDRLSALVKNFSVNTENLLFRYDAAAKTLYVSII